MQKIEKHQPAVSQRHTQREEKEEAEGKKSERIIMSLSALTTKLVHQLIFHSLPLFLNSTKQPFLTIQRCRFCRDFYCVCLFACSHPSLCECMRDFFFTPASVDLVARSAFSLCVSFSLRFIIQSVSIQFTTLLYIQIV